MLRVIKLSIVSLGLSVAAACGTAVAATPPANDDPVCEQGVWAVQGEEKKYVCLTWRFQGQLYTLEQLESVLAPLGRSVPVVVGPEEGNPTVQRQVEVRKTDAPAPAPAAAPLAQPTLVIDLD